MIAANNVLFSQWLRETMVARFPYIVTPTTLAAALNVNRATVYAWVDGRGTPKSTALTALAAVLGVSESEIISALDVDPDYTAKRYEHRKQVDRILQRERYANDAAYMAKVRTRQSVPEVRKTPARKHAEWLWTLPDDERIAFEKARRSRNSAKRRARRLFLGEDFTAREFWDKTKALGYVCCYCGKGRKDLSMSGQDLTADHVFPLVLVDDPLRRHLASNSIDNVFPACFSCNSSKGARDLMSWAADKGYCERLHPAAVAHYRAWPKARDVLHVP